LARIWGMRRSPGKNHILTFSGDYHGWTLGAHQLSGTSAAKPWLPDPCPFIHHLPFPRVAAGEAERDPPHWQEFFERGMGDLAASGVTPEQVAGVFVESVQGRTGLPLPIPYVQKLRRWTEQYDALLIFDEVQTGFGRTGRWFAFEHYGVQPDLICIAKGVTSGLPLAAVLGPAEILDVLAPGEIMTTHAAHPLSCAAALANLKVIEDEGLVEAAEEKGKLAREELRKLQARFREYISDVTGLGLLNAVHVQDPATRQPAAEFAWDWIWAAVRHGVMLFHTNRPILKVCPPLVIPVDALVEGIQALGDALEEVLAARAETEQPTAVSSKR
jgi:4-aminobutyrate aminotransferase/(S)-3-amino-2-methylpropionate transaminase